MRSNTFINESVGLQKKIKVNFHRSKKRLCRGFNSSALPTFHYSEPSNEEFPIIETDDSEDENSIEFEDLTESKRLSKLYEHLAQSQIRRFYDQLNRKLLIGNPSFEKLRGKVKRVLLTKFAKHLKVFVHQKALLAYR